MANTSRCRLLMLAAAVGSQPVLAAQGREAVFTAGLAYAAPLARLGRYLKPGWGVEGSLAWRRPPGIVGLRVTATYLAHPFRAADSRDTVPTLPASVLVTSGGLRFLLTVGPELTLGSGSLRATLNGAAGIAYASTLMSLAGLGSDDRYNQRKRYSDLAPVIRTTAGTSLRLNRAVTGSATFTYAVLGPTQYGLDGTVRVGVISGPYWQPVSRWSQLVGARLGVSFGRGW